MIYQTFFIFSALNVASAFIAPMSCRTRVSSINMVAVLDGKQRQLDMGKEKYAGRSDLTSMVDEEENEVDSYSLFADADEEAQAPPKAGQTVTTCL
jgi:hypothetical protein